MLTYDKYLIPLFVFLVFNPISGCSQVSEPASAEPHNFVVAEDIEWARPQGHILTMDIYTPATGKESYPVLVIFHGGGWLINDNSIMKDMSEYIASHSEYVVCNVNYRLLGDNGNTVTMNQIIEDAIGAVLWVMDNISAYKGNPLKLIVTGDSAGGHLAAMVVLASHKLEADGFQGSTLGYKPTYLPAGKTIAEITAEALPIKAAILSYAAYDIYASALNGFENASNFFWNMAGVQARGIFGAGINVQDNPAYYKAVSPVYNIPEASERHLPPHLCTAGSRDNLITPQIVQSYVNMLKDKGHEAEYWEHEGRPHAFLDSGSNEFLDIEFTKDAVPAIRKMIEFLDKTIK